MFLVPFFDLQNFILLVRTVPFLRKIIFISSYTAKNNYFLLYELIQDLPYCRMLQGEHSAILSTFIKLPFVIKIFVLSIFGWPLKTGFTVLLLCIKIDQNYAVL